MEVEEYDYIILGTGVVECSVGCILSANGKRVLHIDKNKIYGTEFSTMKYTELEAYFGGKEVDPELSKLDREFNIDLTPKLLLADSAMKNILLKYNIDEYITFSRIPGSFIYKQKLHAVPTNETQSLKTGIIGTWQKHKVIRFFWNVRDYAKCKMEKKIFKCCKTMREQYDKYGLNDESREFIGHAIALNLDDSYLDRHPYETFDKIFLYVSSVMCYENNLKSPYIYPEYGLSEISQGFARKSAIQGSVFMLNTDIISMDLDRGEIRIREPMDGRELTVRGGMVIMDQGYMYDNGYKITGGPFGTLDSQIEGLKISEKGDVEGRKGDLVNIGKHSVNIADDGGAKMDSDTDVKNSVAEREGSKENGARIIESQSPDEHTNMERNHFNVHGIKTSESDSKTNCPGPTEGKSTIIPAETFASAHHTPEYYEIIRSICILKGDAEELTRKAASAQVIFLKSELRRRNDVFVVVLGHAEKATPAGYKVAIISTVKETNDPHKEIQPVLEKIKNKVKTFLGIKKVYRTSDIGRAIFTRGIDETTHFESIYSEVKRICENLGYESEFEEMQ